MSELLEDLRALLGDTYRIDRELGGGGMSKVFLAEERALGRRVVLKVLPPDLSPMLSAARFEREVRLAARLQHPHIVPLLAAGQTGATLYYTMPLVEGESLRSHLDSKGELPVADAIRLCREIADALAYAHREGVVHRDIKPDNILLSHQHAMVTDFGIARAVSEAVGTATLTQSGMAVGTPAYMAPEQAAADAQVDHRADIYALGVVAYEMLAGHPPFRGSTYQALVAAQLTQVPPPLQQARPSVTAELAAVIHRCLEKRPADRFQNASELLSAIDRLTTTGSGGDLTPQRLVASPTAQGGAASNSALALSPAGRARRTALKGVAVMGVAGTAFGSGIVFSRRSSSGVASSFQRLTFRRGMIRTARFAPDGQTILYGALWDGDVCRVYTVRPESPESAPLTLPPAAPVAVSSAGELAVSLGNHDRGIMPYGTLARLPLAGGAPRELQEKVKYADWSPDGRDLAIVRRVGEGDVLEFPMGTVVAKPASPDGGFSFPRVSPTGDAVAAFELTGADGLFGRVVIMDRAGTLRIASDKYFNVFGLAWRGDEVWFTAAESLPLFRNTVYAMNGAGRVRIVARVPGNTSLHDIASDGRILIARTDDRSGLAVRAPGASAERDLSWLDGSSLAGISRDGRRILFREYGVGGGPNESTYLRSTDGDVAIRLGEGIALALSPDGEWAIVRPTSSSSHFDLVPTGPGQPRRIERRGLTLLGARWHPDGQRVVVRAAEDGARPRLFVIDVDGETTRPLTPDGLFVGQDGWVVAPDGSEVAVSTGERLDIYALDGSGVRRIPGEWNGWRAVGWIDRGLLISENPVAGGTVLVVDPVTGRQGTWADLEPRDPSGIMNLNLYTLAVTPDGRSYGYSWHRATSDLYVVSGWE